MAKIGRPTDALKHKFQAILEKSNAYIRLQQILAQTKSDETFMRAFDICHDRAYGKALQVNENFQHDDSERPSTEALIETIRALREQLNLAREGTSVETGKPEV